MESLKKISTKISQKNTENVLIFLYLTLLTMRHTHTHGYSQFLML